MKLAEKCKKLQGLAKKYKGKFEKLDAIVKGGTVVSFNAMCLTNSLTSIVCDLELPNGEVRHDFFIPVEQLDAGNGIYKEGDYGVVWLDALWAYQQGLIEL